MQDKGLYQRILGPQSSWKVGEVGLDHDAGECEQ